MEHSRYSNCYDIYFKRLTPVYWGSLIDWRWMKAMALAESGLNPEAISTAGAIGVMQLMPVTAEEMAEKLKIACLPEIPHRNIQMGIFYSRRCWNIFKAEEGLERIRFMLGSYNAGPRRIIKAQRIAKKAKLPTDQWTSIVQTLPQVTTHHAQETINYVTRVESYFNQLQEAESC